MGDGGAVDTDTAVFACHRLQFACIRVCIRVSHRLVQSLTIVRPRRWVFSVHSRRHAWRIWRRFTASVFSKSNLLACMFHKKARFSPTIT